MTKTVDVINVEEEGRTVRKADVEGPYRVIEYRDEEADVELL